MAMTIGRVTGLRPLSLQRNGERLSIVGSILATSTTDLRVAWAQLRGLADNEDEEIVPVTWDVDSTVDGFYWVRSAGVAPIGPEGGSKGRFAVELERLRGGYAFPQQEMVTGAFTRTNAHGLTGDAIAAVWPGVTNAIRGGTPWVNNGFTRIVSDGATVMQIRTAAPTLAPTAFSWWTPPASHYYGSARIEVNIGGTWYLVVGRQIPISDYWRISNGMIRLTSGDSTTPGTIEVWNGSAWESRNIRHYTSAGAAGFNIGLAYDADRSPVTIIRNSPEKVVVRCASDSQFMNYSVQRGHRHVELGISPTGDQGGIGLDSSHAAACTAITGGIRATANDANGNQIVFGMAGGTLTTNLISGFIYSTGGGPPTMMVGVALDGSAATARNTPAHLMDQFIGVAPVTQQVVSR